MLLKDFIRQGTTVLGDIYSKTETQKVISIICEHFLGVKSYTHIVEPEYEIDANRLPILNDALSRLREGEPVQYVIGEASFGDLVFKVNPSVLIPRPETEMLVREAIAHVLRLHGGSIRVLDLCTGSGCIAWSIALSVPGVEVVAVDISDAALELASSQPFSKLLRERHAQAPKFLKADILEYEKGFAEGLFDIIISNPPYIMVSQKSEMEKNVLDFEPSIALFAPEGDPLAFYRAISVWAKKLLVPEGIVLVEVNDVMGAQTADVFSKDGFREVSLLRDFRDKDRVVMSKK